MKDKNKYSDLNNNSDNNLSTGGDIEDYEDFIYEDDEDDLYSLDDPFELEEDILDDLERYRFDPKKEVKKPSTIISIDDHRISTPGNLTVFSGKPKDGKSTFINYTIIEGLLINDGMSRLGLTITQNENNLGAIAIDTEQSHYEYHRRYSLICKELNIDNIPDWFYGYSLCQFSLNRLINETKRIFRVCASKHNGIHIAVIDGVADYISTTGDEAESIRLIRFLSNLSKKYNCPIILVLHKNKSNSFTRGFLGSELERKCESHLDIKKKDSYFEIIPELLRNSGDCPKIQWGYKTGSDKPVLFNIINPDKNKSNQFIKLINELFKNETHLSNDNIRDKVMDVRKVKDRQARNIIKDMIAMKLIEYDDKQQVYSPVKRKVVQPIDLTTNDDEDVTLF